MRYVFLAAALLLSRCGAQPPPPMSLTEIQQFIGLAERAVRLAQKVENHAPADEIQSLTRQLNEAALATKLGMGHGVNQGNSKTIRGLDVLTSGTVRGCARAEATEVAGISDKMPEWVRQQAAMHATECAAMATEYLHSIRDQDIADDVGFAIVMAYPVAIAAHVQAGFQTRALLDGFRDASEAIVTKLAPECHRGWVPNFREWTLETRYECVAYNGVSARGPDRDAVAAQVTRSTSRGVAAAVLAMLNPTTKS